MWARNVLAEMGYKQGEATVVGEDNKSTIAMIDNDCHGPKTKHIDIRYNLIREQVRNKPRTKAVPTSPASLAWRTARLAS
mmetsp:Transcript_8391/g.8563  ORF Transcript_8391/g.8563 Transcript_8391/m.8563 type:complete len:80 (-) Transcript_8391:3301-3540(-)